jgi:hypothetical protein
MFGLWVVLFVTIRRRNGWATVHDFLTGTRVVAAPRDASEDAPRIAIPTPALTPSGGRIGAFAITGRAGSIIQALDENLRRPVWIVPAGADAPAVSQERRDLSRSTRLRWLQGIRHANGSWDAYEAPRGVPLTAMLNAAQPWKQVRCWLSDLSEESQCRTARRNSPAGCRFGPRLDYRRWTRGAARIPRTRCTTGRKAFLCKVPLTSNDS